MVSSLPPLQALSKHVSEGRILGKRQNASFPKNGSMRVAKKLQLMHRDICGSMQTPSFRNYLYLVTFIDDYSSHAWVYRLKARRSVFCASNSLFFMAENVLKCKMSTLHFD